MFVGTAGHPHARLQRALEREDLPGAHAAALDLGQVSLPDAFRLLLLIEKKAGDKFERAAVRFVARFASETPTLRVHELQLLASAVAGLQDLAPQLSLETIAALADKHRQGMLGITARRAIPGKRA
jgi:hypothetical protein